MHLPPKIDLVYTNPEIYRIYVPLVDNPLHYLNSYLIKTKNRNLLIDTGFDRPECAQAIHDALSELDVDINKTDLFVSHLHGDHSGLMYKLLPSTAKLYISAIEDEYLDYSRKPLYRQDVVRRIIAEGLPLELLQPIASGTRGFGVGDYRKRLIQKESKHLRCLADREAFYLDDILCVPVITPGHTPGHMCLYMEEEQVLFLADQVLFDISPNIAWWPGIPCSLGDYLNSLELIRSLPVKTCFVGHRENKSADQLIARIDELILHHNLRLQEVEGSISQNKPLTAYEIMQKLTWRINGGHIAGSNSVQQWFALFETLAHLDYLVLQGTIERIMQTGDETIRYLMTDDSADPL